MDDDELERRGVGKCRMSLVNFLRSRPVDFILIFLILIYSLMVFAFFLFEDNYFKDHPDV